MLKYSIAAVAGIGLLSLCATAAHAQTKGLDFTGGNPIPNFGYTLGWDFSVSSDISVSGLGVWDEGSNGLSTSHQIGIWDSGNNLIASTTITNANSTASSSTNTAGQWLFTSVTPVTLAAGNYTIGALFAGTSEIWRSNATVAAANGITYGQTRFSYGSNFAKPTVTENSNGYFGPNFQFGSVAVVPEANTATMLGLALPVIGTVVVVRRRKKQG